MDVFEQANEIVLKMGQALAYWQGVESAHFRLFRRMVGADEAVCSIIYFSTESFEARRKMMHRVAEHFLKNAKFKSSLRYQWGCLNKDLKDANEERNKVAHYSIQHEVEAQTEMPDGGLEITFGPPRLRPSAYNLVSALEGKTPDKDEHNLSAAEVVSFIDKFISLEKRIIELYVNISRASKVS
jgi:hypothetical protein